MALVKASKTGATPFKFLNKGDTLKGYYKGRAEKIINGEPTIEHTYKTEQGTVSVLGQANILKQLSDEGVTPGTYVQITFTGNLIKLKHNKTMKEYDLAYDMEDRIESSAPSSTESSYNEDSDTGHPEEEPLEELTYSAPSAPLTPVTAPSAGQVSKVQGLVKSRPRA